MAATEDTRNLTGARWSSAVTCPRSAVYGGRHVEREEPSEYQRKIWRRGQIVGRAIADEIAAELGDSCIAEAEVPWPADHPIGTGHMDLKVPDERLAVEVVTTAGCALPERKAVQVAGYALNDPDCDKAMVVSVDPNTGDRRDYPIDIEGLRPQVEAIEADVVRGLADPDYLPDRVCKHPHDGPAQWCPFVAHCFANWQRPDLDEVFGADDNAAKLADATDEIGRLRAELHHAEELRDVLRDELRPFVPAGETVAAGAVTVRRTVSHSRRFSLSSYEKAGHSLDPTAEEFVSESESERWTVKRSQA